jgi:Apea-like HEPN
MIVHFPEFRSSLLAWRRAAIRRLTTTPEALALIPGTGWERDADGNYRPVQSRLSWNFSVLSSLDELPEFNRVQGAVAASPTIAKHFDTLVGTAQARRRWDLRLTLLPLLPQPRLGDDDTTITLVGRSKFGELYRRLEQFLVSDSPPVTTIWPIRGITLEQTSLTLEPGIVVRRLTEPEIAACIGGGLIKSSLPSMPVMAIDADGLGGLVVTRPIPKVIGEQTPSDALETMKKLQTTNAELIGDFRSAVALLGLSSPKFSGAAEPNDWSGELSRFTYSGEPTGNPWMVQREVLSHKTARELKKVWHDLRCLRRRSDTAALGLAARRLSYVSDRSLHEDQILDLMIAAEALYLADVGGDRGELKYRLALRAAAWADNRQLGLSHSQVFELMKRSYDVRSAIAHGSHPTKGQLKIQDEQLSLDEFVERSGAVIRAGVRKALNQASKSPERRLLIDWEALVLRSKR